MTADEQAIQDVLTQIENACNAGDSTALAASFVEDANFIHIYGGQLDGRRAVEDSHRYIFDTIYKGSQVRYTLRSVRFVRPDVAIVFSRAHLTFYEGNEAREVDSRPTFTMVKEQGKWQIAVFQKTRISEVPAVTEAMNRRFTS